MEYVDIDLISRIPEIKIEFPYLHVPTDTNPEKLHSTIIELLKTKNSLSKQDLDQSFDFYIDNEIFTNTLSEYILHNKTSTEKKISIEFDYRKSFSQNFHLKDQGMVSCIDVTSKNIIVAAYNKPIKIISNNGKNILEFKTHNRNVKCIKSHKIFEKVVIASSGFDTFIRLSEYSDECRLLGTLKGHSSTVLSLNFMCHGTDKILISTCFAGEIGVWDLSQDEFENMKSSDQYRDPLMIIGSHINSSTGSSNIGGMRFVTCGLDSELKVWNIDTAKCDLSLSLDIPITCISYSSGRKLNLVGSKQPCLELIDILSNNPCVVHKIDNVHKNSIFYVDWCPYDDNYFVSGSWDGILYLWDIRKYLKPCSVVHKGKERIMTGFWAEKSIYIGTASGSVISYNIK